MEKPEWWKKFVRNYEDGCDEECDSVLRRLAMSDRDWKRTAENLLDDLRSEISEATERADAFADAIERVDEYDKCPVCNRPIDIFCGDACQHAFCFRHDDGGLGPVCRSFQCFEDEFRNALRVLNFDEEWLRKIWDDQSADIPRELIGLIDCEPGIEEFLSNCQSIVVQSVGAPNGFRAKTYFAKDEVDAELHEKVIKAIVWIKERLDRYESQTPGDPIAAQYRSQLDALHTRMATRPA